MKTARRRPEARRAVHPARRQRPERRDGPRSCRCPAPSRPTARSTLEIAFRAKLPRVFARTGLRARLLPRRPVVPEDRRLRAGGHARPQARRLELPRRSTRTPSSTPTTATTTSRITVPSKFVVGATGKRVSETRERREDDLPLRPERRPRLRLDGRPALPRRRGPVRPGAGTSPRAGAARAAEELGMTEAEIALEAGLRAPAPAAGPQTARERVHPSRRRWALSFYGLWFGAYPYETLTDRRSAGGRRRLRRHGVPDVHHGLAPEC